MPLETAFLLNPPRRRRKKYAKKSRRRARRRYSRPRRRRNSWGNDAAGHARAARKGWRRRKARRSKSKRSRRSRGRRRNPVYRLRSGKFTGRRTGRRVSTRRRRRNPGGAMSMSVAGFKLGIPEVMPGIRIPLPGIVGQIANGVVQGVVAGGVAFAGYAGSGALADYILTSQEAATARAAGQTFKGTWARPLIFTGITAAFAGLSAAVAPKSKKLLWSLLAAAGPAMRAFGGVLFAIAGGEAGIAKGGLVADMARMGQGLSDYLQMGEIYEAGLGEEEDDFSEDGEGMEDYLQMGELYEAGMGAEQEVVGI